MTFEHTGSPRPASFLLQQRTLLYGEQDHLVEDTDDVHQGDSDTILDSTQPSGAIATTADAAADDEAQRQAQMDLYDYNQRRMQRRSMIDLRGAQPTHPHLEELSNLEHIDEYDGTSHDEFRNLLIGSENANYDSTFKYDEDAVSLTSHNDFDSTENLEKGSQSPLKELLNEIPAILIVSLICLLSALPFGVAYFPIGWAAQDSTDDTDTIGLEDGINGPFPLPNKAALGIRMSLFATIMGQIVMSLTSNFTNAIAYQLIENVPFYHELARIVIQEQGYGIDALATLFFLFGLSSILLGAIFFSLGHCKLGRILYFFPTHVLAGFIGGIGIFISITSISVTNNADFTLDEAGIVSFMNNFRLFGIVIVLEVLLRILMWLQTDKATGAPKFALLAPAYFCMVVPVFYIALSLFGISMQEAEDAGYFFPAQSSISRCEGFDSTSGIESKCTSQSFLDHIFDGHVLDIFRLIDFRKICWPAVMKSLGTVVSLASFSLIHAPINIPAFSVTTDVETDMNIELKAHGYANVCCGMFGGLQTIMTYSFSALFFKSGGKSRIGSLGVAGTLCFLFIVGPQITIYIPRCMAGLLLLHIGIDLILEGIVDSIGSYDYLEYCGILLIAFVMTTAGMTAALVAGIIAALSTYAVQSITNLDPIFSIANAETLRSSTWTRSRAAFAILEDTRTGRTRVLIVQLQGHLFFGNITKVTDTIKETLSKKRGADDEPFIVIVDFTLVVGMDSSAAHAVSKLKKVMHRTFHTEVAIFVSGSHRESFPCDYALTEALSCIKDEKKVMDFNDIASQSTTPALAPRGAVSVASDSKSLIASQAIRAISKSRVFHSMDEALQLAEDILIARESLSVLQKEQERTLEALNGTSDVGTIKQERARAQKLFETIAKLSVPSSINACASVHSILSKCKREEFLEHDILWRQGSESDSMKLIVSGQLRAHLENSPISETIQSGNLIGELGLVQETHRLSTVVCISPRVVAYTLERMDWKELVEQNPTAAFVIDQIVIRYLSHRVQHVSNRIFETRCLPI